MIRYKIQETQKLKRLSHYSLWCKTMIFTFHWHYPSVRKSFPEALTDLLTEVVLYKTYCPSIYTHTVWTSSWPVHSVSGGWILTSFSWVIKCKAGRVQWPLSSFVRVMMCTVCVSCTENTVWYFTSFTFHTSIKFFNHVLSLSHKILKTSKMWKSWILKYIIHSFIYFLSTSPGGGHGGSRLRIVQTRNILSSSSWRIPDAPRPVVRYNQVLVCHKMCLIYCNSCRTLPGLFL